MEPLYAYVYFSTSRSPSIRSYYQILSWLIRVITRSPMSHCAIGFAGTVLDPSIGGVQYHSQAGYEAEYPGLLAVIRVPVTYLIDLSFFEDRVGLPIPPGPTIRRWTNHGRGPWTRDCLCTVLECLLAGGIKVPLNLYEPKQLHRWLIMHYFRSCHIGDRHANIERGLYITRQLNRTD